MDEEALIYAAQAAAWRQTDCYIMENAVDLADDGFRIIFGVKPVKKKPRHPKRHYTAEQKAHMNMLRNKRRAKEREKAAALIVRDKIEAAMNVMVA